MSHAHNTLPRRESTTKHHPVLARKPSLILGRRTGFNSCLPDTQPTVCSLCLWTNSQLYFSLFILDYFKGNRAKLTPPKNTSDELDYMVWFERAWSLWFEEGGQESLKDGLKGLGQVEGNSIVFGFGPSRPAIFCSGSVQSREQVSPTSSKTLTKCTERDCCGPTWHQTWKTSYLRSALITSAASDRVFGLWRSISVPCLHFDFLISLSCSIWAVWIVLNLCAKQK